MDQKVRDFALALMYGEKVTPGIQELTVQRKGCRLRPPSPIWRCHFDEGGFIIDYCK